MRTTPTRRDRASPPRAADTRVGGFVEVYGPPSEAAPAAVRSEWRATVAQLLDETGGCCGCGAAIDTAFGVVIAAVGRQPDAGHAGVLCGCCTARALRDSGKAAARRIAEALGIADLEVMREARAGRA